MNSIRPWCFALMIAVATPAGASDGPAVDDAQIDRLIAVLPHSEQLRVDDAAPDAADLARLMALNPSHAELVRRLLATEARCRSSAVLASTRRAFREVGRRLGRTKVERLIQFYAGPDFRTFAAINEHSDAGSAPSDADQAAVDRIMRDYPIMEMATLLRSPEVISSGGPSVLQSVERCLADRNAAFTQAGLRQTEE